MTGLTPAQEKVFRFVREYITRHGYSPSYEEVRRHLGFKSLNSVYKHLKQLEGRGYLLTPWNNKKRVLDLAPLHSPVKAGAFSIPFLGTVAAGIPIEVVQTAESIEVPENFLGNGSNFALRVRGDSMIEDGIRDGDILIITQQPHAENGQTVVALVAGEATVKKFYRRENEIELKPANSRMKSIVASAEEVELVGVVMGLLRNYRNHRHLAGREDSDGNLCSGI
ncbi:MAG: transcriptional repressor LexA [Syntrophobacteraceae bacterium]|jgi:repressor LexA